MEYGHGSCRSWHQVWQCLLHQTFPRRRCSKYLEASKCHTHFQEGNQGEPWELQASFFDMCDLQDHGESYRGSVSLTSCQQQASQNVSAWFHVWQSIWKFLPSLWMMVTLLTSCTWISRKHSTRFLTRGLLTSAEGLVLMEMLWHGSRNGCVAGNRGWF